MGKKRSEERKIQIKGQRPSSNKRKVLPTGQENSTEKKPKHTDTEYVADSEGSVGSTWCDIEDSDYKLNELNFDLNMTDSHNITFGDNQFVLNPSQHFNTNSTVLNTGQPMGGSTICTRCGTRHAIANSDTTVNPYCTNRQ
jgi:hypothetical protein